MYLFYVSITQKIVSSNEVVFGKTFSSSLAYTSHPYSDALAIQTEVSYILYATSSHEQTGNIITFAQSEEGTLVENECNTEEYASIPALIGESSKDDDSDDGSISTNDLDKIWDGSQIQPEFNTRDAILKICEHIKQTQNEWKVAELS